MACQVIMIIMAKLMTVIECLGDICYNNSITGMLKEKLWIFGHSWQGLLLLRRNECF